MLLCITVTIHGEAVLPSHFCSPNRPLHRPLGTFYRLLQAVAKRLRHSVEISPLPPKTLFLNLKRSRNAPSPPSPIAMLIPFSFNARSR